MNEHNERVSSTWLRRGLSEPEEVGAPYPSNSPPTDHEVAAQAALARVEELEIGMRHMHDMFLIARPHLKKAVEEIERQRDELQRVVKYAESLQ